MSETTLRNVLKSDKNVVVYKPLVESKSHPRNVLRNGLDLESLAVRYPQLNKHFKFSRTKARKRFFNFSDRDAVIELTRVYLKHLFDLELKLSSSNLIPRLTLRLNYIHFLEDLVTIEELEKSVEELQSDWNESNRKEKNENFEISFRHGIDIGVGSTVIYPLLMKHYHKKIEMIGTEINERSFELAIENWSLNHSSSTSQQTIDNNQSSLKINNNNNNNHVAMFENQKVKCWNNKTGLELRLQIETVNNNSNDQNVKSRKMKNDEIKKKEGEKQTKKVLEDESNELQQTSKPKTILLPMLRDNEYFLFCMCNPPFFASEQEKNRHGKRTFAAASSEVATAGGEIEFVTALIDDSLILRRRVRFYTSMLGKQSSLAPLQRYLEQKRVKKHGADVFSQGKIERQVLWWQIE